MKLPKKQDVIWIDYEPHKGNETGGHDPQHDNIRRPMIVLNDTNYIQSSGLVIGMPTTHQNHSNDPIHYIQINDQDLSQGNIYGYIIPFKIQCFDFEARHGEIVDYISDKLYHRLIPYIRDIFDL